MRRKGLFFLLVFILITTITAVSFAAGTSNTTAVSVTTGTNLSIIKAVDTGNFSDVPNWTATENSTGSTNTGDLYIVDAIGADTGDFRLTIYLNNPEELAKNYSYMNLQITVFKKVASVWVEDTDVSPAFMSLTNGYISFDLKSGFEYSISLTSGSFYCISTTATGGSLSPDFYTEAK